MTTVYVLIETADVEILGIDLFSSEETANKHFDACLEENEVIEETNLEDELDGTIRFAGDEAYAIQLLKREIRP